MEANNQVENSFSSSAGERDSSSDDESMDLSYYEQLLHADRNHADPNQVDESAVKTRTSSRLLGKRLQTSANISGERDAKISISLERFPTRRPDPNTINRNALMARENRRKKKEYVTKLEEEIDDYKSENKKLRKILKQQFKALEKFKHEKSYFQSILANQTQITTLVNLLKTRSEPTKSITSSSGYSASSALGEFPVTGDFDFDETLLPRYPEDFFRSIPESVICNAHASISSDHNYSNDCVKSSDPGVCLHICGDQLSLEFCVECADNAKRSWLD